MGGGAMLVMAGLMTYMIATKDNSENAKVAATATQSITISTDNLVPLTFQMSAATVDICYSRSPSQFANEVNLLDPAFVDKMKALGFNRMLKFADGAISNVSHIVLAPAIGKGYNGLRSDYKSDKDFAEAMGGVLAQTGWKSDFFLKTTDFVRAVAVPDDVVLNPNDTWEQNKYRIANSSGEYIFLGSEELSSKEPRTWTASQYIEWAKPTIDSINRYFPGKKIVADQGQLYTSNSPTLKWRKGVTPSTLPGVGYADCYLQGNDALKLSLNLDSNILKIDNLCDNLLPMYVDSFKRSFPGWKWIIGELHFVDAREGSEDLQFLNKNMVGVYWWFSMYIELIKQQALIPAAVQMELKKYGDPKENNTKAITMLNSFLKPGYNVTTLTLENMAGCSGVSINNIAQPKSHSILIKNNSGSTYTLTKVIVNGKAKSPVVTQIRIYASTWDGVVTKDTVTSSTITILPKSGSVLSFTIGTTVPSKIKFHP